MGCKWHHAWRPMPPTQARPTSSIHSFGLQTTELAVHVDDKGLVLRTPATHCWREMNSLTYLSRQFDVLASPRTPPSTPSEERTSFLNDGGVRGLQQDGSSDTTLKRVKTWSTKSFLFSPSQQPFERSTPKRSYSSPADIITLATLGTRSTTTTSSEAPVRSKSSMESLLRRVFFVRVFVVLWRAFNSAWV